MLGLMVCRGALLGFWVFFLLAATTCYGENETVEVVGAVECADCTQNKIKISQAFAGLHVTIDCKSATGHFKTRGSSDLDKDGKFRASLPYDIAKDGDLKEECFAQIHSASGTPCAIHNGLDASKIIFKSKSKDGKQTFSMAGKLKFSPMTCTSAFLWPFFKHPPLPHWLSWPKLPHFPGIPIESPPPQSNPSPPVYNTPLPPPPMPVYNPPPQAINSPPPKSNPSPPPAPVYNMPLPPPPMPVYNPPPAAPTYENLVPPPAPVPIPNSPPPSPVYTKPPPPPVPIYKKPIPPPVPVYKEPPPPPPVPIYKKPIPPPVPVYKKPPPPPVPIYKTPIPPPVPAYKKPIPPPPPIPIYTKPLPPPVPVYKKPPPPPVPIYKKPIPPPVPAYTKPLPPPKSYSPIPKAPPIPKLPPIPSIPRKYFNTPVSGHQSPLPP